MSDDLMISDLTASANEVNIRENALHLKGVDNLSTHLIKEYLERYINDKHTKIEWINDHSLNIVFDSNDEASDALVSLTREYGEKSLEPTVERLARIYDKAQPEIEFTVRVATTEDKKVKNASAYSRYYLLNPEEQESYRRERLEYRRDERDSTSEFREREVRRRKRANADEGDLFPELLEKVKPNRDSAAEEEDAMKDDVPQRQEEDLFARIKPNAVKENDLFSRIRPKASDKSGDLFSRLGSKDKPADKSGDLLSRIGSNEKFKDLADGDLFKH